MNFFHFYFVIFKHYKHVNDYTSFESILEGFLKRATKGLNLTGNNCGITVYMSTTKIKLHLTFQLSIIFELFADRFENSHCRFHEKFFIAIYCKHLNMKLSKRTIKKIKTNHFTIRYKSDCNINYQLLFCSEKTYFAFSI